MAKVNTSQRRLSAIMFSDICGYSRLMGRDEARAMEVPSPRDIRIREIHFEDDRTSATVIPEIRREGGWKPIMPARWHLREDDWYLVLAGRARR